MESDHASHNTHLACRQTGHASSETQSTEHGASDCPSCAEYLAGWKRAQADYQNLVKDTDRERREFANFANENLLHELLPALDQLALALKHVPETSLLPDDQRKTWDNWLTGLRAVQALWEQTAANLGLKKILVDGAFDPKLHEAAGEETVEGQEPGTIARVIQDGWQLHAKVLRPTRVIVAK